MGNWLLDALCACLSPEGAAAVRLGAGVRLSVHEPAWDADPWVNDDGTCEVLAEFGGKLHDLGWHDSDEVMGAAEALGWEVDW